MRNNEYCRVFLRGYEPAAGNIRNGKSPCLVPQTHSFAWSLMRPSGFATTSAHVRKASKRALITEPASTAKAKPASARWRNW